VLKIPTFVNGDCRQDGGSGNRDQHGLREDLGQHPVEDAVGHNARQK